MRSILPKDLPNFRPLDPTVDATDYPFESAAVRDRIEDGRLLAAYAALAADGRFVVMPLLATASVPLTAKFAMQLTLFDPATGARVETRTLAAGETFTLSPRDASVIVGARHSR
jgi:hypothetical protein